MSSTASQVQQRQQAPPVHPPGEHPLAQLVRDNTNHGEMIVHFLIDAMRGRIDAAKPSHRIDAARLLLKLGSDDAREFIADFSRHTRPGGGSAFSSGAIVGRHNRKYVTRLAKFARSQTGNGKHLVNFLVDAMLGRPEDFKPAARLAAARELLRLGWETVPTVGRNRKARRSEAAANGLLVDSRKAASNGAKANGRQAAHNGRKANGPQAAHNGRKANGRQAAANGRKANSPQAAANGAKTNVQRPKQQRPPENLPGDRTDSPTIRQPRRAAANANANGADHVPADPPGDPEPPPPDRPTPPAASTEEPEASADPPPQDPEEHRPTPTGPSRYEREAMRKGIDIWRDPAGSWISADINPLSYQPSTRIDSTSFPRGP